MTFPLFNDLNIETIGSCNRTCPSCLRQSHPKAREHKALPLLRTVEHEVGKGEKLPEEVFRSVVDQAADLGFAGKVVLQFFNEPFLDDRLPLLGAYVRTRLPESQLVACSNADFLTTERAKAVDGIFHKLNVSLYMPKARKLRRRAEVRAMFSKTKLEFRGGMHVVTHYSPDEGLERAIENVKDQPCTFFSRMLIVTASGDVAYCCEDVAAEFGLGNVKNKTLREIWYSEKNQKLTADLSKPGGRLRHPYCASCPRPETGMGRRKRFLVHDLERKLA